jgi:hypothetical protein
LWRPDQEIILLIIDSVTLTDRLLLAEVDLYQHLLLTYAFMPQCSGAETTVPVSTCYATSLLQAIAVQTLAF